MIGDLLGQGDLYLDIVPLGSALETSDPERDVELEGCHHPPSTMKGGFLLAGLLGAAGAYETDERAAWESPTMAYPTFSLTKPAGACTWRR